MTKKNYIYLMTILLFFPVFLLFPVNSAKADVISPPSVEYCAKFSNIDAFDDYVFLKFNINKWRTSELYEVIKENVCLATEGNSEEYLFYAIKKNKFDEKDLKYTPKSYYQYLMSLSPVQQNYLKDLFGKEWTQNSLKRKAVVALYLKENKDLIPINVDLNIVNSANIFSPIVPERIEEIFRFKQKDGIFEITKIKRESKKLRPREGTENKFNDYLIMFLLTLFVEFLIFSVLVRKFSITNFLKLFAINLITIGFVIFVSFNSYLNFYLTELCVVIIEILLIKWFFLFSFKKSLFYSLIINISSIVLSYILTFFKFWG